MNADTLKRWLQSAAVALHEQRDSLMQYDAEIGDADHGTNMDRGFAAVAEQLETLENPSPRDVLVTAGSTLVATVGGASGPLWGTAFRRAGRVLGDEPEFDLAALVNAFAAALDSVIELGGARVGDKTMVDALDPAVQTLRIRWENGDSPRQAADAARAAAELGAKGTAELEARKGRASYVGQRSIGHPDPGAMSTAIVLAAFAEALAPE